MCRDGLTVEKGVEVTCGSVPHCHQTLDSEKISIHMDAETIEKSNSSGEYGVTADKTAYITY